MKATEAESISSKNSIKNEEIFSMIKGYATNGIRSLVTEDNVSDNTIMDLVNLGYSVSRHTDPFGRSHVVIKW